MERTKSHIISSFFLNPYISWYNFNYIIFGPDFLYKFIAVVLPSIRDFRGIPTKFDGAGNYNYGISDHTIFPEVTVDPGRKNIGMDITIVTTATDDNAGRELLKLLGMPFRKSSTATTQK